MARAQLAALACAGLLIGGHEQLDALADETPLAPALRCVEVSVAEVRRRVELVHEVGDRIGDPGFGRTAARFRPAPPCGVPWTP